MKPHIYKASDGLWECTHQGADFCGAGETVELAWCAWFSVLQQRARDALESLGEITLAPAPVVH